MADDGNGNWYEPSSPEERARKQARVRGMTDPLGSMGFRDTSQRYRREARARRGVFGGAAASFVIGTALIIAANERGAESAPSAADPVAPTSQVVSSQGAAQPQSVATENGQPVVSSTTAPATEAPVNGLNGDESDEILVKARPSLSVTTNRDDDEDDDHWYEDEDDEDDDEHEHASSSSSQGIAAPSVNAGNSGATTGSSGQNEIVIVQPKPHTQTNSTRD
jgi:Tfp pilus assembly major pilin PilA